VGLGSIRTTSRPAAALFAHAVFDSLYAVDASNALSGSPRRCRRAKGQGLCAARDGITARGAALDART
jgi:hypothetical protein